MQASHGIGKLAFLQNRDPPLSLSSQHIEQSCHASSLSCVRGDRVLFEDLSFTIEPAQCIHLIGANGSGKTSLLRIIAGLNRPESGEIGFNNLATGEGEKFTPQVAYLGHKDGLKTELSAFENLAFYANLMSTDKTVNAQFVDSLLHRMELLQCAEINAGLLSFGQRRRLAFARLLIAHKQLWILDEPFTGIDRDGRELIESLCIEHLQSMGSIIISNHQDLSMSRLAPNLSTIEL